MAVGELTGTPTVAGLPTAGSPDILVVQYDEHGRLQWTVRAGGPGDDVATAVAVDAAGNSYVAGSFAQTAQFDTQQLTSTGNTDAFLASYNPTGQLRWIQALSGPAADAATAVGVDSASQVVWVAGAFAQSLTVGATTLNSPSPAAFLAKFSLQGAALAAVALPGSTVAGLSIDATGCLYAVGTLAPTQGVLAKFDPAGTQLWVTPAAEHAWGSSVATDDQGRPYVAGRFRDTLSIGPVMTPSAGSTDGFLAAFDSQGTSRWTTTLGGADEDHCRSVTPAGPGLMAVTGHFRGAAILGGQPADTGPACAAAFVVGYDYQGAARWLRSGGGAVANGGTSLVFDPSGTQGAVAGAFWGEASFGPARLQGSCSDNFYLAHLTTNFPDLVISSAQSVQGSYHHVTVTAGGSGTLTGGLQVTGTLTVQAGGQLVTACHPLAGPGNFVLADGAELHICHPAGLAATGPTGAIQLSGSRSYSTAADYVYDGVVAQQTGAGLPSQVRRLTVANPAGLTLTSPASVREILRLASGNLLLNGQLFTLLSDATGTAQTDNTGGIVLGEATVQRYILPDRNAGLGYRHLAAPVANTVVADLATNTFTPVTNSSYNSAATPGTVRPYPTVLAYDETRLATATSNLAAFDKGWYSPPSLATPLQPALGYSVHLVAGQLVDFVGTLNNGSYTVPLSRGLQTDAGWNLLGNPYPSTLDWSRVAVPAGLDNAAYIYESTGPYAGQYRSYVNGIGNPLIGLGQAFFVHLSTPGSSATLTLTNAARLASYTAAPVRRPAADPRPRLTLTLREEATGRIAETTVYFEPGATATFDPRHDARQLPADSATVALGTLTARGEILAVNGLPASLPAVVWLTMRGMQPGAFRFEVAQLANMSSMSCQLHDVATGRTIPIDALRELLIRFSGADELRQRFYLTFTPTGRKTSTKPAAAQTAAKHVRPRS